MHHIVQVIWILSEVERGVVAILQDLRMDDVVSELLLEPVVALKSGIRVLGADEERNVHVLNVFEVD